MPWEQTQLQRILTIEFITKRRLNAPVIWLKPESLAPDADDALKTSGKLNTNLEEWRSENDERNLALRLVDGFIELQIKAPDEIWFNLLAPLLDTRAAFGPQDKPVSSVILKIEDPTTIDRWATFWPKAHKDKAGAWVGTKFFHSIAQTGRSKASWRDSKPLPGSRFGGDLIVWRPKGKPPATDPELGLEDLEARSLEPTSMESVVRAIAFATLGYWVQVYLDGLEDWDASLTRTIGGWIARLVREGQDINARGQSLEGVCWAPIDDAFTANELIQFLRKLGATRDLEVAFAHAEADLERNPSTPVPGWGAIETLFGPQARVGIRHAFKAGLDINVIEQMSEQYIYDRTAHEYLDREALLKGLKYEHAHDDLIRDYQNAPVYDAKGKPHNPFKLYSTSSLRTDVHHRDFRPQHKPGAILRYSPVHGLLNGEDQHPDEYRMLNTFPGFAIKPIATIDAGIMSRAISMLDRMLGFLTRDNDAQMMWLKKFNAQIAQDPGIKPQVCPIIVGGQGIGKSQYGDNFQRAMFGGMAGLASADSLRDNKFSVTPFIGKLITFIDEVRFESIGSINTIKKLVRAEYVSGETKNKDQRDHYIPTRLMIASNSPDIGLSPADAADRAFFFVMAWTAENKGMTDTEFQAWALTLKPFYAEFIEALESVAFRQHLMRYFVDLEVTRAELEDLTHSSRDDENVVRSTMSKTREVARAIVADARVVAGMDITSWFTTASVREAIKRVDGSRTKIEASDVMMEFRRAGVLETVRGDLHKFKYRYRTLIIKMGEAHNLPITNNWDYEPDDEGDNEVLSAFGGKPWRGNRQRQQSGNGQRRPHDPDSMSDF
jgi:Family of unknown function (DUF5906)